ncbi:hypothetical protein E9998_20290 [Glycomyces paridis]|uniref:Uncharacterized protein n=1 Tax=Glycomyces paridis TaxID=2126555 RepID=A0A4S8P3F0_9ACTN|nr:hypothetical protein E9998_20290 [Glycomyces paridis]
MKIGVTAAGADPEKAAAAESRISRGVEAAPAKTVPVAVAAALGALAVITAVAAQWFLAVVFALAVLVPLWMHRNRTADHAATLKDRDEKLADLRAAILKARDEAAARDASAAERHAEAEAARARLLTALPQGRH